MNTVPDFRMISEYFTVLVMSGQYQVLFQKVVSKMCITKTSTTDII